MTRSIRYGALALFLFLMALVYVTTIQRTKGFSFNKIHSHHCYDPKWDFGPPHPEQEKLLKQIGEQPFTLLGSGKECYAFVSEDGEIVVKFFKQKHMKTRYLLNYLPLTKSMRAFHNETIHRHKARRQSLYQSYQIAYEKLQDETGVIYLHLTKTKYLKKTIHLRSKQGKPLTLNLDDMEFMVQRRATPIFDEINAHPENGERIITSIVDLIKARKEKGIGDNDINCERNLGIYQGKAFQIDVGEFYPMYPEPVTTKELHEATLDLRFFLERNHPQLITSLDKAIATCGCDLWEKKNSDKHSEVASTGAQPLM